MKRHWIEYTDAWVPGPMSFWVHGDDAAWTLNGYRPPKSLPPPGIVRVAGRGYPAFYAEVFDFTFHFASLEEVRACLQTLSNRVLPSTIRETERRGAKYGPNNHWLSRLPSRLLSWPRRQKIVQYLSEALDAFEVEIEASV